MSNQLLAKPILKNKFWIVEDQGSNKIATIQAVDDGSFVYVEPEKERKRYPSIKLLSRDHNIVFDKNKKIKPETIIEHEIYGYPISQKGYNVYWDVKNKFAVFTKNNKSKSFFCAGFYIIKFNNGWVKSFCPKLITLNRYEYKGPFTSKMEMQEQLRLHNQNEISNTTL
jgi:hypothetical protein